MYRKKIAVMVLVLVVCFTNQAAVQQIEQITCTGKVIDIQGRPVAGAKVTAYEMIFDGIAGNFTLHRAGEVMTAEDGAFVFTTEPKPEKSTFYECKIVAVKPGLALGWTVWKMREDATSDIRLGAPEKLEGVIVDDAGKPVSGADVRANLYHTIKTADGEEKREWLPGIAPLQELGTQTNSQGKFFFKNLPANVGVDLLVTATGKATTYTYQSAKNEPAFKAGQTDIRVALPAEARIEGKILDPDTGKGIAGTKFAVVATSSGLFYYRFVHTTNEDGTFKVGGLQSDRYLLRNGGFPHTFVEVESGKTANITVKADRLSRPRGVTGGVRDPQGKRLPGAIVSTYPSLAEELITDAKGAFTLRSARTRRSSDVTTYLFIRHKDRNLAAAEELDESARELDITLALGVILSGKVVDVDGKPIPSAELSLTFRMPTIGHVMHDVIGIDNAGHYEICAVPPGQTYSVTATAEGYGQRCILVDTGGAASERIELEPLVLAVANLSASGIVVDEFDQPISKVTISVSGDGQPSRQTLTDAKGRFTIENICSGRINIYADKRAPRRLSGRAEAEAGATDIRIVVAEIDERGRRVPRQPPSRVGKPLPELTNLNIELSPTDIDGKMVLVCFWDMQQRPSRNTLLRLTKQAEELKRKGVTVVTVQAVKVDESTLDEWVKENNIPFPIGMAQDDETKTYFTWGIKSLPWLILTDHKHVIIAEGFGLTELDAKIENIGSSASAPNDSNEVTGQVKDPNGQLLSGVRVTEFQTDKDYTTDADGRFVSAYAPSDERRFFFAVDNQRKLVGVGILSPGERHVEIKLTLGKMVSGTVVDPDGKPVVGAQVAPLPMTCFHVLTDNQGWFDVGWDPKWAGDLDAFFLMARHLERNLAGGIEIDENAKTVRIELGPALTLTGTVEEPNGVPIPGAEVGLSLRRGWACGTPVRKVITDEKGRYSFPILLQKQEYINYADAEGFWRNQITTGIINRITGREQVEPIILKRPNLSVSGTVMNVNGELVANIPVYLRGEGQPALDSETGAEGRFIFEKVCCGPIQINAKNDTLFGTIETEGGEKNVKLVVRPRFE